MASVEKPFLDGDADLSFFSSIVDFDVLVPLRDGLTLQFGLPFAIAGADGLDETSIYLGNLSATLVWGEPDDARWFLGLAGLTATDLRGGDAAGVLGLITDLDRPEEWANEGNLVALRGGWQPSRRLEGGQRLGLRLEVATAVFNDASNMEVWPRVGASGVLPVGSAEIGAELSTSYAITNDDGFGEAFTAYLDLFADFPSVLQGSGLFVRVPLDGDGRQFLDLSVGVRAAL